MANVRIWGITTGSPALTDVMELQRTADGASLKATVSAIAAVPNLAFTTPDLGTPTAGDLVNCTGYLASALVGTISAAGSDTQVQFNDGGVFGADAALTFDKTTGTLYLEGPQLFGVTTPATTLPVGFNGYPVGPDPLSAKLQDFVEFTDPNATVPPQYGDINATRYVRAYVNPSIDDPQYNVYTGVLSVVDFPASNSKTVSELYGAVSAASYSGTSGQCFVSGALDQAESTAPNTGGVFGNVSQVTTSATTSRACANQATVSLISADAVSETFGYLTFVQTPFALAPTIGTHYGISAEVQNFGGGAITTAYLFYGKDLTLTSLSGAQNITNPFYQFYAAPGVYAIRNSTVDGSGKEQASSELYNPRVTKYVPGAADYERMVQQWNANVAELWMEAGGTGTLRNMRLGPTVQFGRASSVTGAIALAHASSAFLTTIQAGNAAAAVTYTWPTNVGAAGSVLTDAAGNGTLSWAAAAGGGLTVGTTTITSGTTTRILYDNAGVLGEYTLTGTGTVVAMATAPTLTGATVDAGPLTLSGNQSVAAWTTSGVRIKGTPGTLTDTTSSGTVATAYTNVLGGNTIAASNVTTFTDYYSTFISDPVAGSNVTLTNKWSLGLEGKLKSAGLLSTALATITQASANAGIIASTGYSLTGSNATNMIDIAGTWNTSGNPIMVKIAMTNTASGSTTKFASFLAGAAGATEVFSVDKAGAVNAGLGSSSAVAYGFVGDPNTGMYSSGADAIVIVAGGNSVLSSGTSALSLGLGVSAITLGAATSVSGLTLSAFLRNIVNGASSGTDNNAGWGAGIVHNIGASSLSTRTLPVAAAGKSYTYYVADTDGIKIQTAGSDTIRVANKVTAAGGYLQSTTIGSSVTIACCETVNWVCIAITGTWTDGTFTYTDTSLLTP